MSNYRHYTLDDAAKKLSISVDQLLQAAENGEITLSFRINVSGEIFFDYKELTEQDGETFLSTVVANYTSHEHEFGAYINLTASHAKEVAIKKQLIAVDALPAPESDLYVSNDSRAYHAYKIRLDDIVIQQEALEAFERYQQEKNSKPNALKKLNKQLKRELIFFEWLADKDEHMVSQMKKEDVLAELRKINPHLFMGEQKHFFRLQKRIIFQSGRKAENND